MVVDNFRVRAKLGEKTDLQTVNVVFCDIKPSVVSHTYGQNRSSFILHLGARDAMEDKPT